MIYKILKDDFDEICKSIKNFDYKNILISGGCGFIGYYLVKSISRISPKSRIIIIDNLEAKNSSLDPFKKINNIRILFEDLTKINTKKLNEKYDLVIHLAGIPSPFHYMANPLKTLDIAVNGTRVLLEISKKNQSKFIFFSSSEIYGDPDPNYVPTEESYRGNVSTIGPRACYDESKRIGETLCYIYGKYYGVYTNTIRPFNFFGPGMDKNDFRVIPVLVNQSLQGKDLKVFGKGQQTRTFCYITDAIIGSLKVINKGIPGEVYNIGQHYSEEIKMIDLAKKIKKITKSKSQIKTIVHPELYPTDDPNRRAPNIDKAIKQLNFIPSMQLNSSLERFIGWAKENY